MDNIREQVFVALNEFLAIYEDESGYEFDYSFESLKHLDTIIEEVKDSYPDMSVKRQFTFLNLTAAYLMEVAARNKEGDYEWNIDKKQPQFTVKETGYTLLPIDLIKSVLTSDEKLSIVDQFTIQ